MLALAVCEISVRPELVEGRTPSMLRQAQHERGVWDRSIYKTATIKISSCS